MKSTNNWLILMTFFYKKMKRIIKERTVLNMMIDYTFVYTTNFLWYSNYYKYLIYIIVIIKFLINVYLFIYYYKMEERLSEKLNRAESNLSFHANNFSVNLNES